MNGNNALYLEKKTKKIKKPKKQNNSWNACCWLNSNVGNHSNDTRQQFLGIEFCLQHAEMYWNPHNI